MQETIVEQPIQPTVHRTRGKIILAVLIVLVALSAGGYFLWLKMNPEDSVKQPQSTVLEDGTILAPNTSETFDDPKNSIAIAVGSCIEGQQVTLGSTGVLVYSGKSTLKDEPYCNMALSANGKFGTTTFDCVYKLDNRSEIYLQLDDSGADADFIRQHCLVRE